MQPKAEKVDKQSHQVEKGPDGKLAEAFIAGHPGQSESKQVSIPAAHVSISSNR